MKKNKNIHFIITGGTIDSHYDGTKDTVAANKKSVIPDYIKNLNLYEISKFTQVCMKDSRNLNEKDLKKILNTIEKSPCKKVVITIGTYTMPDTARFIKSNLKRKDQVIVLTGSLIPLVGFTPSDGGFNLGYSVAEVEKLRPGIYVCMNGRIFSPGEVLKMLYQGRFSSIKLKQ